ncbi:hypothetical protein F5Y19DRAFT_491566 [Xylariaceae sp. FL1651]|nr:hypothetical protein F5Y19DRAFT_491566 [Xylariaceae sp. FL1651]
MNTNRATGYDLPAHFSFNLGESPSPGPCSLVAKIKPVHPKLLQSGNPRVDVLQDGVIIGSFTHTAGQETDTVINSFACRPVHTFQFRVPAEAEYGNLAFTEQDDSGIFMTIGC